MLLVGLTGSIGMGKSTTATMFKQHNFAVYNADDTVHYIYENDDIIINKINRAFPGSKVDGKVSRNFLKGELNNNPKRFKELELIIHPATREYQISFINQMIEKGCEGCILDIPLLFETGGEKYVDTSIVVTASKETQFQRVIGERGLDEDLFNKILLQQMPDEEKCKRADYVISSNTSIEETRKEVEDIVTNLTLLEPKAWNSFYKK